MPTIIKNQLIGHLQLLGADKVSIDNVDFNPFTGKLKVEKLTIFRDKSPELQVGTLVSHIAWSEFFSGKIKIEDFSVSEIDATLRQTAQVFRFAGLDHLQVQKKQTSGTPYSLILKLAAINNLRVHYYYNNIKRTFLIRNINIHDIDTRLTRVKKGQIKIGGKLAGGNFHLESELINSDEKPKLLLRIKLDNLPVETIRPFLPAKFRDLGARLNYAGTVDFQPYEKNITVNHEGKINITRPAINTKTFSFSDSSINITDKTKIHFKYNSQNITGNINLRVNANSPALNLKTSRAHLNIKHFRFGSQLSFNHDGQSIIFKGRSTLGIKKFILHTNQQRSSLLEASGLLVKNIKFSPTGIEAASIHSGALKLANTSQQAAKSDKTSILDEFQKQLIFAEGINIDKVSYNLSSGLSINSIGINDSTVYLYRHAEKWPVLRLAQETIKQLKLRLPGLKISSINLSGNNKITIYDDSFKTPFRTTISINTAVLNNIDNQNKHSKMEFQITGSADQYTKFDIKGNSQPFANKLNLGVSGSINEINLPKLSPYTRKYAGYDIQNGQMDLAINLSVADGNLGGKNKVRVRRLKLTRLENFGTKIKISLPVDNIVSLFSNKNKELTFTIPNSGNIYDPKFKMGISYVRAMEDGVKSGLKLAVKLSQPVGQTMAALGAAKKLFISLRLRPLYFDAGSNQLDTHSIKQLSKLARFMKKSKHLTVKVCPTWTTQDINKQTSQKLAITLADSRGQQVKEWLVKQRGISSKRIYVCQAKAKRSKNGRAELTLTL